MGMDVYPCFSVAVFRKRSCSLPSLHLKSPIRFLKDSLFRTGFWIWMVHRAQSVTAIDYHLYRHRCSCWRRGCLRQTNLSAEQSFRYPPKGLLLYLLISYTREQVEVCSEVGAVGVHVFVVTVWQSKDLGSPRWEVNSSSGIIHPLATFRICLLIF
jgi:hypothetical protein